MKMKRTITAGLVGLCGMAQATFVTVGNPGNAADTTGYGAVGYTYQISATEVTIAEFTASGAGSGNEDYWNDAGQGNSVGSNAPASCVSLYEAMKYCNWLTSGDINLGAYQFSGGVYQFTDRASAIATYGTVYAVPTEDEWYKAAYFKPGGSGYSLYANGTGTVPVAGSDANYNWAIDGAWVVGTGVAEQNGTRDMMGNVWEWMEDSGGVLRGGSYFYSGGHLNSSFRGSDDPENEYSDFGFRIVAIPEPATALLFGLGGLGAWLVRRNNMKSKEAMYS